MAYLADRHVAPGHQSATGQVKSCCASTSAFRSTIRSSRENRRLSDRALRRPRLRLSSSRRQRQGMREEGTGAELLHPPPHQTPLPHILLRRIRKRPEREEFFGLPSRLTLRHRALPQLPDVTLVHGNHDSRVSLNHPGRWLTSDLRQQFVQRGPRLRRELRPDAWRNRTTRIVAVREVPRVVQSAVVKTFECQRRSGLGSLRRAGCRWLHLQDAGRV